MPMVLLILTVVPVLVSIWSVKVLVLVKAEFTSSLQPEHALVAVNWNTTTCPNTLRFRRESCLLKALNTMELWRAAQHRQGHRELSCIVSSSEPNWQRTNLIALLWLTKGLSTHFPTAFCLFIPTPRPFRTDMWNRWHSNDIRIFFFMEKFHVASGYVYQSGIELMLVGFSLRQTVQQQDRLCCYKALHHTESLWRLSCDQIWTEPEREQPKKQNKTEKKKIQKLVMWIYSLNQFCYTSVCVWVFKFYPIQVSRKRQMFPYNPIKHDSIMQQHLQVVCVQMCLVTDHYRGPCVCARLCELHYK